MASLTHPSLDDVDLATVLHALSDPGRLAMVRKLANCDALSCGGAGCPTIPRSTLSNHFRILRAAGIVRTRPDGRAYFNELRRSELDARFPGLLQVILAQPEG